MPDFARKIHAVDSHTAGEPTRVVTEGLPDIPGVTMVSKRAWLAENLDELRRGLVLEPRGHNAIVLAYLMPKVSEEADIGVVFSNEVGYLGMCGHGAIGVATVMVGTGLVAMQEPVTRVVLDTPAGLVEARVYVEAGKVTATTIRNVPSFMYRENLRLDVPGFGSMGVDIAYGGNWFAIVSAGYQDLALEMKNLAGLLGFADAVRKAVADAGVQGFDPMNGEPQVVDHIEIYEPREVAQGVGVRTVTLCPGMEYDRSPCGTGTSAKLAVLHAKGELEVGQAFHNRSITGTDFIGTVVEASEVDGRSVVIPDVRGSAYITGLQQFVFDPDDPLVYGLDQ